VTTHWLEAGEFDGIPYRAEIIIDRAEFVKAVKRAIKGTRRACITAMVVVSRKPKKEAA